MDVRREKGREQSLWQQASTISYYTCSVNKIDWPMRTRIGRKELAR